MPKRTSRQKDENQLAKAIVDAATGSGPAPLPPREKNPAAVALGKLGGVIGGPARAKALTKERRAAIARKAAQTRWRNKGI